MLLGQTRQRDYQAALGQEVLGLSCAQSGRDLYPVTEGTCETSRTGSSQEGVMHSSIGGTVVDAGRPLGARSSIAQFACRILEETRKRGQFRTSSEVLDRKELLFRTLLDEYRKVKQDPDRERGSREMKSRLIDLRGINFVKITKNIFQPPAPQRNKKHHIVLAMSVDSDCCFFLQKIGGPNEFP